MITFGRRGGALLLSIATGGLLIGGVAVAAPASVVPASLQTILGAGETDPPAPSTPQATRQAWRTAAPAATALPTAAAAAPAPVLPAPTPTETATPTAAPTTAVPVRAMVERTESAPASTRESGGESDQAAAGAEGLDDSASGVVRDVIELTNEERRNAGCGALQPDARLTRAAQGHASDMAENGYFAHESQDGTRFDTRIKAEGYSRPGGENIAKGQTSAEQVVREWMDSPPHRRNIENCAFTTIGAGYADDYWVQDFGR